ncbi:protein binding protein, putative, partial [Musa troglodytarum]
MGYDAMANGASVPALISRDAAKKKRANRSAKLKQCKLDVRREQWLSRAHGRGDRKILAAAGSRPFPHPPRPRADETDSRAGRMGEEDTISHGNGDPDYPMPHLRRGNRRTLSSGSSIESGSPSVSDAEDEEIDNVSGGNRVLDDWEAVADALSEANDRDGLGPGPVVPAVSAGMPCEPPRGRSTTKPEPIRSAPGAWRPDDAFRPRSLPGISKRWSIPPNQDRHCWASPQKGVLSTPCPCPICCEDLDPTDSSF